jgi:hypothetical protein
MDNVYTVCLDSDDDLTFNVITNDLDALKAAAAAKTISFKSWKLSTIEHDEFLEVIKDLE